MSKASQEILFLLLLFCLTWYTVLLDCRVVNTVQVRKEELKRRSVLANLKCFKVMQISEQSSATCTCKRPSFNCAYISDTLFYIMTVMFWSF